MSAPKDAVSPIVTPAVREFIDALRPESDPLVARMEALAEERRFPLVGRHTGQVLEWLTRAIGGRRVFEFGSGYGYSAYFFARAVGPEGRVYGADRDGANVDLHRDLFDGHPLASRIELRAGDAFDVFARVDGPLDVVFLDLDKADYQRALDAALPKLRAGGLVLADNVLWGGKVAMAATDASTAALVAFDRALVADERLDTVLLAVGDGLAAARKR